MAHSRHSIDISKMNDDIDKIIIGAAVGTVGVVFGVLVLSASPTHLVTLKILRRRTHRSTEMPKGCMAPTSTSVVSRMPPQTTKQSKRLKKEET